MRRGTSSARSSVSPSGLSSSEAIFASSLFGATPIEHESPVAARTASLIDCATSPRAPPRIARRLAAARSPASRRMHVGQVDVDLVDAVVLDLRRDRAHRGLEQPRILAVRVEVGRQQHRVGRELRGLHQAHRRVQAERPRLVGRRGDDAAPDVAAQRRERADRATRGGIDRLHRLMAAPAADDDRPSRELRIAQELDRRIEGVHVEMRDQAGGRRWAWLRPWRRRRRPTV